MNTQIRVTINQTPLTFLLSLLIGGGILYAGIFMMQNHYPSQEMLGMNPPFSAEEIQMMLMVLGAALLLAFAGSLLNIRRQSMVLDKKKSVLMLKEILRGQSLKHEIAYKDLSYLEILIGYHESKLKIDKNTPQIAKMTVKLFRKNGTHILIRDAVTFRQGQLHAIKTWLEYLPIACKLICEIPEEREACFANFQGLPQVELLQQKKHSMPLIVLQQQEKVKYELPRLKTFKEKARYISEHDQNISTWRWASRTDLIGTILYIALPLFYAYLVIKSFLYDELPIVFVIIPAILILIALYFLRSLWLHFTTGHRLILGVKGITYSLVGSQDKPITDISLLPFKDIYAFSGAINADKPFVIYTQQGFQDFIQQQDTLIGEGLALHRLFKNTGLFKPKSDKLTKNKQIIDFEGKQTFLEEKGIELDIRRFGIAEVLYLEEMILKSKWANKETF